VAKVAANVSRATEAGRPSIAIRGARRRMLEAARRTVIVGNEGRTNRCR